MAKIRKLKKGECKDIVEVTIQFENCECYTFTREEISNIFLHNIVRHISICVNAVIDDNEAQDIWFVLPYEIADRKQKVFGFGEEESLIQRLGLDKKKPIRDITHFYLKYNTGEEESVSCVWEGEGDFDNPAQKAEIIEDKTGKYVTIYISKDNL